MKPTDVMRQSAGDKPEWAGRRNLERVLKLRSGFLAGVVPGSECLNRDGAPLGSDADEYSRKVTPEEAETPLVELFADVPQEPMPWDWAHEIAYQKFSRRIDEFVDWARWVCRGESE